MNNRGQIQKSKMGICNNKFWLLIFSLFALWSVLICLNYSSLIDSVSSLAKFYVYSVNYQEPISISSNLSNVHGAIFPLLDDEIDTTISIAQKTEEEKTGEKKTEVEVDEIDKLLSLDFNERQKDDPPIDEKPKKIEDNPTTIPMIIEDDPAIKGNITLNETTKENSKQKKKKRKGKSKRRKPPKISDSWEENTTLSLSLSPPPPPPPPPPLPPPLLPPPSPPPPPPRECKKELKSKPKSCKDRYIFMHSLPRRYHMDLLRDCKALDLWMDMCEYVRNSGLGPELRNTNRVFSKYGWFGTNQFLLEVIFHNRMKQYECLTNDSSIASAIYVPFYAGLDVARHLWNTDSAVRDSSGFDLVKLLRRKQEWRRLWGRDHFFVAGRITWDFRRSANKKDPDWGTKFLYLPESKNMTALVIESSPWNNNDFGIPYPTYFHPANDQEVFNWQDRMSVLKRKYLFTFAGAPRPDRPDSIRNQLINQCDKSKKCIMVHCNNWKNKCHNPPELMKVFQDSVFCLQPPGDSYTRRSTFDSMLAGCIPVFFHPGSAYIQYLWHLPKKYTKYSVFIPMYDVRGGKVNIQSVLERIPPKKVKEMREEVIKLIPNIIYADPRCRLETVKDAFDVAVKGVLERVKRIKEDMRKGKSDSFGYDERQAWKYRWLGKLKQHEWDPYFSGTFDTRNFTNF